MPREVRDYAERSERSKCLRRILRFQGILEERNLEKQEMGMKRLTGDFM